MDREERREREGGEKRWNGSVNGLIRRIVIKLTVERDSRTDYFSNYDYFVNIETLLTRIDA